MDKLLIDWRRGDGERAYVVLVRDGVRQEMLLTREEIRALDVDYTRTQIRIRLPIPPELERLSRRWRRKRSAKDGNTPPQQETRP
jgi:hypothetical protein